LIKKIRFFTINECPSGKWGIAPQLVIIPQGWLPVPMVRHKRPEVVKPVCPTRRGSQASGGARQAISWISGDCLPGKPTADRLHRYTPRGIP